MEEFHNVPASGIGCEDDMPQGLRIPFWRKEIAIPIVLGNILGLYLNSGMLMGVAVFFFKTDLILLLTILMVWLYTWYWYTSRKGDSGNQDWPGACLGGVLFGLVTAYMHLLTKVTPSVNLEDPTAWLTIDPDSFTRAMAPDLSILPGHFNYETLLVFFIACVCGVLSFRTLPKKISVLVIGVLMLVGYLWSRERILSTPENDMGAFSDRAPGGSMDWRMEVLGIAFGNGLAVLLLGGTTLLNSWNVWRFLGRFWRRIRERLSAWPSHGTWDGPGERLDYPAMRKCVLWGWVLGIFVAYNFRVLMFLPDLFMGAFIRITIAVLFQMAMIRQLMTYDRKSIPYRIVSLLGGLALGTAFVKIPDVIYDGLRSQRSFTYQFDATITTRVAAALFIFGVLLGTLLLTRLSKSKALLIYGLCMFTPACITVCPPVMAFYIGPGSFVGLAYAIYLPILYLPVGFGLACIVVGIHNIRWERRIRKERKEIATN